MIPAREEAERIFIILSKKKHTDHKIDIFLKKM
ncbi:hypothetical protein IMSAGC009_03488 [Lachnospiraceae bacterium]|jgi:hypothetical protein|nr:hypothetical protein IMSAGC009_03488 [Lachnospiraceae bacterium]